MTKLVGSIVGMAAISLVAVGGVAAPADAVVGAKARVAVGQSCPNSAVWNKPKHTSQGWIECKIDKHDTKWHWVHI